MGLGPGICSYLSCGRADAHMCWVFQILMLRWCFLCRNYFHWPNLVEICIPITVQSLPKRAMRTQTSPFQSSSDMCIYRRTHCVGSLWTWSSHAITMDMSARLENVKPFSNLVTMEDQTVFRCHSGVRTGLYRCSNSRLKRCLCMLPHGFFKQIDSPGQIQSGNLGMSDWTVIL